MAADLVESSSELTVGRERFLSGVIGSDAVLNILRAWKMNRPQRVSKKAEGAESALSGSEKYHPFEDINERLCRLHALNRAFQPDDVSTWLCVRREGAKPVVFCRLCCENISVQTSKEASAKKTIRAHFLENKSHLEGFRMRTQSGISTAALDSDRRTESRRLLASVFARAGVSPHGHTPIWSRAVVPRQSNFLLERGG